MLQSDSMSVSVIRRDDHDRALWTYPTPRHHSPIESHKTTQFHYVTKSAGLVHNHPSGSPEPSRQDIEVTRQIADAGKRLNIAVHDHIIIGAQGHVSMRAKGLL